jgi:osmotically inducible protein OsmC
MESIQRTAAAVWHGTLKAGNGQITSPSGVLNAAPYSFKTRFEHLAGTNPEELIAAAHAACYSMAFAHSLSEQGYQPQSVETRAVCSLEPQTTGGFKITTLRLITKSTVPGIDGATFQQIAQQAEAACPVSNALRGGVKIELEATLVQ